MEIRLKNRNKWLLASYCFLFFSFVPACLTLVRFSISFENWLVFEFSSVILLETSRKINRQQETKKIETPESHISCSKWFSNIQSRCRTLIVLFVFRHFICQPLHDSENSPWIKHDWNQNPNRNRKRLWNTLHENLTCKKKNMRSSSFDTLLITFENALENVSYREEESDGGSDVHVETENLVVGVENRGYVWWVENWESDSGEEVYVDEREDDEAEIFWADHAASGEDDDHC